jgi:hypothetical protein
VQTVAWGQRLAPGLEFAPGPEELQWKGMGLEKSSQPMGREEREQRDSEGTQFITSRRTLATPLAVNPMTWAAP